jgi:D-sedoheptulose 7-phosphate isomerase
MAELDAIDYLFSVPSSSVHRIQETQTTLYHLLWELTQQALAARPVTGDEANDGWRLRS